MSKARNLGELLDANGDVLANHLDHQSTSASDLTSGTLPAARLEALTLVAATQAESDNSTKVATTAYVTGKITTLIGGAPSTLNDLNELAAAINDDASYHSTLTTALATKLPLAGGTVTGGVVIDRASGHLRLQGTTTTAKNVSIQYSESGDYGQINCDQSGVNQKDLWVTGLNLRFGRNTSIERMIIKDDGNVGIGTTSPDGKLHVHTASAGTVTASTQADDLVVENNAEGGITLITPDDQSARIRFTSPANNGTVYGGELFYRQNINKIRLGNTNADGVLSLSTGTGGVDRLLIDGNGKVGIGTSAPSALLEISSGSPTFILNANSQATNKKKIRLAASQITAGDFHIQQMNDDGTTVALTPMTIKNGGSVGINNTSPNHAIDVNGDSVQNGVRTFTARFNVANNAVIGFDVVVPDEGGGGNSFMIHCGHNHYYVGGYGTHRIAMVSTRGTNISDVINVGHQTSGNGGSWTFSKPSATLLRITKNAGSYGGGGAGFIHVVFSSFM